MVKAMLVGVLALATIGTSVAEAEGYEVASAPPGAHQTGSTGPVLTEMHISSLRSTLNLTAEQARHWPPVEAALRAIVQSQAEAKGVIQRLGNQAGSIRRLMAAARPLIRSLDAEQKREAIRLARSMGFAHVARAF
jgi:hypothetical protein